MHNPSSAHPKSPCGQGSSICRLDQLPPATPREEIVQGLIAAGEICSLSGRPGAGKTALAIHLAKAVTEGSEFLGRPCIQGPVLFVACEKAAGTERRLKAIIQRQKQAFIRKHAIRLDSELDITEFIADLVKTNIIFRLIIIDTFARALGELDENSNTAVGIGIRRLAEISDACPTAAIILSHHLDKKGDEMRGATAFGAAVDIDLRVSRDTKCKSNFTVTVAKANHVDDGQKLNFRMFTIDAADGEGSIVAAGPLARGEAVERRGQPVSDAPAQKLSETNLRVFDLIRSEPMVVGELNDLVASAGLIGGKPENHCEMVRQNLKALQAAGLVDRWTGTNGKRFVALTQVPKSTQEITQEDLGKSTQKLPKEMPPPP